MSASVPSRFIRTQQLLNRILDDPALVRSVQSLPAQQLGALVRHVGLEDAGEIIALASPQQLTRIFDDDLWRSPRAGLDESFDADRFALWLEVMLEAGEDALAEKLLELPQELVILGLQRHLMVLDRDALALGMIDSFGESQLNDKLLENCASLELDKYLLVSRRSNGWDAIVAVILALDKEHHHLLDAILERIALATNEKVDELGGLYEVLSQAQVFEVDAAADREDRRAGEGYISASSAASFLALARVSTLHEIVSMRGRDPVAAAYFRQLNLQAETVQHSGNKDEPVEATTAIAANPIKAQHSQRLQELLFAAGVVPTAQAALLTASEESSQSHSAELLFKSSITALYTQDPQRHTQRMQELAFLGNVVLAGCNLQGKRLREYMAADLVTSTCNLGLQYVLRVSRQAQELAIAVETVRRESADKLFCIGWHLLHTHLAMPAANKLVTSLRTETEKQTNLSQRRRQRIADEIAQHCSKAKPYRARRYLSELGPLLSAQHLSAFDAVLDEVSSLPRQTDEDSCKNTTVRFIADMHELQEARKACGLDDESAK